MRANTKEFEPMSDGGEPVLLGQPLFQVAHGAPLNFNHSRATGAHQMVMMAVVAVRKEFEPSTAATQIIAFHYGKALEQMHRTIHRGQVAKAGGQGGEDFFDGHRVRVPAEDLQDGLPWLGEFAGLSFQTRRQFRQSRTLKVPLSPLHDLV